ncbi:DUF192 domain-containing protein [Rhodanobacter sp. L36]|uniref:DUF192 domain-containing protein n=1 Tax=Rhodanobacter sp. L36 TaxID=1747221 RepID=UPI00131DBD37|nr:DUF192 domain-containing protein [Rhodanobacter sp. L36]
MKHLLPLVLTWLAAACTARIGHQLGAVDLRGQHFSTEVVTDEAGREYGLMNRTTLTQDHGMLFVFPDAAPRGFWMKNTLIPLDILYFDTNRRLVSTQKNVPPCKADPCATYPSKGPARYVLELSAGTASRIGAQSGDVLKIDGDVETAQ